MFKPYAIQVGTSYLVKDLVNLINVNNLCEIKSSSHST